MTDTGSDSTGTGTGTVSPGGPGTRLTRRDIQQRRTASVANPDPAAPGNGWFDSTDPAGQPAVGSDGTSPSVGARLAPLLRPTGYYLASRIGFFFSVLVVKWLFPGFTALQNLGSGWDGYWYTHIAQYGYPAHLVNESGGSRWAFFPGYPGTIRAVVEVTGLSYADAGLATGLFFGLASAVAVWLAVREVFGQRIADRSVLLYVFFPSALVLSMGYTEGLFIACSGFCLFALSRRYWITASLFAVAGSLTRSFGAILILALVVAAIPTLKVGPRLRPVVAILIAPLGLIAWLGYTWHRVGTPLAFVKSEKYWGNSHFVWFTTPFQSFGRLMTGGAHAWTNAPDVLAAFGLVFVIVGLTFMVWSSIDKIPIPAAWWVFTVGSVAAALSPYWATSVLRYSMAAFPLFAVFAWKLRGPWLTAVVGALAVSQGALTVMLLVGLIHPQATLLAP